RTLAASAALLKCRMPTDSIAHAHWLSVPLVLVARRAQLGERGLELLADLMALARRQEAADHHAVAARTQHQAFAPIDLQPIGIEAMLLALAVGRDPVDDQLAVVEREGVAA